MQKQFIIILSLILLLTSVANAKNKEKNIKFEILRSADQTINQTIEQISEARKIFDKYLNGSLYTQEAVNEINKIQKKIINIQSQTKMSGNNKDMIMYIYSIKNATNKLQNSLEKMKIFIKKDYADNEKRMKDFLVSQTNDIYNFIETTLKAEKDFLYNAEIKNTETIDNEENNEDINQNIEDYIKMRKNLVDIKIKQQEISKDMELAILNVAFDSDKEQMIKKMSDILKKAENIKSSLQQTPKIESMNILREATIESWDISIKILEEMIKSMSKQGNKNFENIIKEHKDKIEYLKNKTKEFSENIDK